MPRLYIYAAITSLSLSEILLSLWQQEIVSEPFLNILFQLPLVGLVVFLMLHMERSRTTENDKARTFYKETALQSERIHKEHINELLDKTQEIISLQQASFSSALTQLDKTNSHFISTIDELNKQLAINTATVSQAAKVDEILGALIENRGVRE